MDKLKAEMAEDCYILFFVTNEQLGKWQITESCFKFPFFDPLFIGGFLLFSKTIRTYRR